MRHLKGFFQIFFRQRMLGHLRETTSDRSNIVDSSVTHPDLISPTALVHHSQLSGPISIMEHAKILEAWLDGEISIGRFTTVNGPNTDIHCLHHPVTIGNFCSIARNVSIQEYNHVFEGCTSYYIHHNVFGESHRLDTVSSGSVILGNDVWVGTQSVILSGVTIADGAVIGANAVVTNDIPPYAVAVGSPARVIKYRFSADIIQRLLEVRWWSWPEDRIRRNRSLFDGPLTVEKIESTVD